MGLRNGKRRVDPIVGHMPFGGRWRASGAAQNQTGYLCFGWDEDAIFRSELYAYDPATDLWTELPAFPGAGLTHVAMVPVDDQFVVFGGIDNELNVYNDLWSFSPLILAWDELSPMPAAGRKG